MIYWLCIFHADFDSLPQSRLLTQHIQELWKAQPGGHQYEYDPPAASASALYDQTIITLSIRTAMVKF